MMYVDEFSQAYSNVVSCIGHEQRKLLDATCSMYGNTMDSINHVLYYLYGMEYNAFNDEMNVYGWDD